MTEPVSSIRNLGPASDQAFARAGITSADQLRSIGAQEAYRRLLLSGTRPHFIGYYALRMGLQGRPWNDLGPDEKQDLRDEFDALVASTRQDHGASSELEKALNALGVVEDYPTSSSPEKK